VGTAHADRHERVRLVVRNSYEIVPRSQEIADAFGVNSFPQHMVIDRSGKIVWLSGSDDDRIERLRAVIFRVVASQPAKPE